MGAFMGAGKYALYGFGGFMLMGAVILPFMPEPTPEEDLASGQRYFSNQCETITRSRKINGKWGRGHSYCECVSENLAMVVETGDEYRFAEALHDASGTERWIASDFRMAKAIDRARGKFTPMLGQDRLTTVSQYFYEITVGCARSM